MIVGSIQPHCVRFEGERERERESRVSKSSAMADRHCDASDQRQTTNTQESLQKPATLSSPREPRDSTSDGIGPVKLLSKSRRKPGGWIDQSAQCESIGLARSKRSSLCSSSHIGTWITYEGLSSDPIRWVSFHSGCSH